jgi:hypothetical protein
MMTSFAAPPAALARSPLSSSQSFRAKQLGSRLRSNSKSKKRLSPLRSLPNDLMVPAEMSTRAYERAKFILWLFVCFMAKAIAYYRRRRFILVPKFRHFSKNINININK